MTAALFSKDGKTWNDGTTVEWRPDPNVTKIVIGTPPERSSLPKTKPDLSNHLLLGNGNNSDRDDDGLDDDDDDKCVRFAHRFPDDLSAVYPNLTHLYLWQIKGLTSIAGLPSKLKCLDCRHLPDLQSIRAFPPSLETLILEHCPVRNAPPGDALPNLIELSIRGSSGVSNDWLERVLKLSPQLQFLDASRNPDLRQISEWGPNLVDLRLDDCPGLNALPYEWPPRLRRLDLKRASSVSSIPDFPATLKYVDLTFTESLRRLPLDWGHPTTLYLFGSGILVPPASEQGKDETDNVAGRTKEFFNDVELTGEGTVKRCKLLILGNGSAGKTSLSLALAPGEDPATAEKLGSTHGVQFWDWDFRARIDGQMHPVHLYLWDFGGQEIYHNTHRLFMSKGAVFILVWNPSQDGQQPPLVSNGFQDEWRPLSYWLDFIRLACPFSPRIALVCSHHFQTSDELEQQWRSHVDPKFHTIPCFYIDSKHRAGQFTELTAWLVDNVGDVVRTQGTAVPAYWEVAQDLVQGLVKQISQQADSQPLPAVSGATKARPRGTKTADVQHQVEMPRFKEMLQAAIKQAIAEEGKEKYGKLDQAIKTCQFELNDERLTRTLEFLTNSGWVYWDRQLFEGRVILGQKWALDGIYAILQRDRTRDVYKSLNRSGGRFTLSQLGEWEWNKRYSSDEQQLLRSFMERCGLCFLLRNREDSWREEDVYVSFEHLPTVNELRLQREFEYRSSGSPSSIERFPVAKMHQSHWQAFLTSAGRQYGKDATYALDGFYLENGDQQKLLIVCDWKKGGLGCDIEIRVAGPESGERLKEVRSYLKQYLPGHFEAGEKSPLQQLGNPVAQEEVFISYAWNPKDHDEPGIPEEQGIPEGYEGPVDAIEHFFRDKPVRLIRDKNDAADGSDLRIFMASAGKCPHVIIVHSDKYWRSAYCMFEVWHILESFEDRTERLMDVVIPVEHLRSGITTTEGVNALLDHWDNNAVTPRMLGWQPEELRENARTKLRTFSEKLARRNWNIPWIADPEKALKTIAGRLKLEGT